MPCAGRKEEDGDHGMLTETLDGVAYYYPHTAHPDAVTHFLAATAHLHCVGS